MQEKLMQYMDENRMHSFDGERGVRNLEKVMKEVCGYGSDWNGVLHNFFTDNPGAINAVLEWIGDSRSPEWEENLNNLVSTDE